MKVFALAAALVLGLGFGGSAIAAPLPVVKKPCSEIFPEEVSSRGESYCTFLKTRMINTLDDQGNISATISGFWSSNGFTIDVMTDNGNAHLMYDWYGNIWFLGIPSEQRGLEIVRDLPINDALALRSMWLSFVYN